MGRATAFLTVSVSCNFEVVCNDRHRKKQQQFVTVRMVWKVKGGPVIGDVDVNCINRYRGTNISSVLPFWKTLVGSTLWNSATQRGNPATLQTYANLKILLMAKKIMKRWNMSTIVLGMSQNQEAKIHKISLEPIMSSFGGLHIETSMSMYNKPLPLASVRVTCPVM